MTCEDLIALYGRLGFVLEVVVLALALVSDFPMNQAG
jgi:hypothetical protein